MALEKLRDEQAELFKSFADTGGHPRHRILGLFLWQMEGRSHTAEAVAQGRAQRVVCICER